MSVGSDTPPSPAPDPDPRAGRPALAGDPTLAAGGGGGGDRGSSEGVLSWVERRFGIAARVQLGTPTEPAAAPPEGRDAPGEGAGPAPFGRRYRSLGALGRGGMGIVMRALDQDLRREVAVKAARLGDEMSPEARTRLGPLLLERFLAEAQITAQLEHPNIVPVHELGVSSEGQVFYTMKVVKGRTLKAVIEELNDGRAETAAEFTLVRQVQIVLKVCDALKFAHARRVVHRDLKPENVMVGRFGEVIVMDWGLAKLLDRGASLPEEPAPVPAAQTQVRSVRDEVGSPSLVGQVMGSPHYMSPEQARGDPAAVDAQTDVFGVGAVLYELLTGNPPYSAAQRKEVQARAALGMLNDPEMKASRRPVPKELRAIARKALAAEKAERYGSAAALAADLEAVLEGRQGAAWRDSLPTRLAKLARRYPARATALVAGGLVALAAFLAGSERRAGGLERDRRERLELDRSDAAAVDEFFRLREKAAVMVPSPDGTAGRAELGRSYLAAFRKLGVPLDDGRPVEAVAEGIRAIGRRNAALGAAATEGLYCTGVEMLRGRAAHLAELRAGAAPRTASDAEVAHWRQVCADAGDLVDLWPRFKAIREAADGENAWRGRVWSATLAYCLDGADGFRALLADPSTALRPAEDVSWLAYVVFLCNLPHDTRAIVDRAIAERPELFWPHFVRGMLAADGGDPRDSVEQFRICEALRPDSAACLLNLGHGLHATGRLEEAIRVTRKALELEPGNGVIRVNLGALLDEDGQCDEAAIVLRAAAAQVPWVSGVHVNLAGACITLGRFDEAAAELDVAARQDPSQCRVDDARGELLERQGDPVGAAEAYRRAVEKACAAGDPGEGKVRIRFAGLLGRSGEYDRAIAVMEEGIARTPRDASAHYLLGRALVARGDVEAAIREFLAAERLHEDVEGGPYPLALCQLAAAYDDAGDPARGLPLMKRGDALGRRQSDWDFPGATWIPRLESRAGRQASFESGEGVPETPDEVLLLAQVASRGRAYARAADAVADALASDLPEEDRAMLLRLGGAAVGAAAAARAARGEGVEFEPPALLRDARGLPLLDENGEPRRAEPKPPSGMPPLAASLDAAGAAAYAGAALDWIEAEIDWRTRDAAAPQPSEPRDRHRAALRRILRDDAFEALRALADGPRAPWTDRARAVLDRAKAALSALEGSAPR